MKSQGKRKSKRKKEKVVRADNCTSLVKSDTKKPTYHKPAVGPITDAELRNHILTMAGYNLPVLIEITRETIETQRKALTAEKKTYTSFQGEITDSRSDADYGIRLKASNDLQEILGVKSSWRNNGGSRGHMELTIKLKGFATDPDDIEAIDAEIEEG